MGEGESGARCTGGASAFLQVRGLQDELRRRSSVKEVRGAYALARDGPGCGLAMPGEPGPEVVGAGNGSEAVP